MPTNHYMTHQELRDMMEESEMTVMDGFEDCIAGYVEQFGRPPIVCYDKTKVIEKLVADGMSYEEAYEYWDYNQVGAWVGDSTPCFVTLVQQ